jgi:hypothetical protein
MAKTITIYCEGVKGSHDYDILEKIIEGISNISIKPIGGKHGANAIVNYAETKLTVQSDFYLLFRDRDFDCPISDEDKLHLHRENTYSGCRTTIENYLLDISLFYRFVEEKKYKNKYNIHSEADVKGFFIEVAKELKYYQAVRHSLGELRYSGSFDTTWLKRSGYLPEDLGLETCRTEGWKLINDVVTRNNMAWTEENFESAISKFLVMFDDDFFDELTFLTCFQGKDFEKALTDKLPGFPMKSYYKFAKEHFDYTKFGDLKQLRTSIERDSK